MIRLNHLYICNSARLNAYAFFPHGLLLITMHSLGNKFNKLKVNNIGILLLVD